MLLPHAGCPACPLPTSKGPVRTGPVQTINLLPSSHQLVLHRQRGKNQVWARLQRKTLSGTAAVQCMASAGPTREGEAAEEHSKLALSHRHHRWLAERWGEPGPWLSKLYFCLLWHPLVCSG